MSYGVRVVSRSKPYWKPEQPPPDTLMRKAVPPGSLERILEICLAARSDSVTLGVSSTVIGIVGRKSLFYLGLTTSIVRRRPIGSQCWKGSDLVLCCGFARYSNCRRAGLPSFSTEAQVGSRIGHDARSRNLGLYC